VYAEEDLLVGRRFMFVRFELEPENVVQCRQRRGCPAIGGASDLEVRGAIVVYVVLLWHCEEAPSNLATEERSAVVIAD